MKTTIVNKADNTQADLKAYKLIKPVTGNFIYLCATKDDNEIGCATSIEFENLNLVLYNLNIGYGGEGPGGLVTILMDVGLERSEAESLVTNNQYSVEYGDSSTSNQ